MTPEPTPDRGETMMYIDYSDLLAYFRGSRLPTGIQRVQIELFKASLAETGPVLTRACAWSETAGFWVALDPDGFGALCAMTAEAGAGAVIDDRWRAAVEAVRHGVEGGTALAFPPGVVLVNLGTSWWMADYMAGIRLAKARYGIRYVPLIYDMIPLITPEHCGAELTSTFAAWASSVFMHADRLGVISDCTRRDTARYAAEVKALAHEPVMMPLDARFGSGEQASQHRATAHERAGVLESFGVRPAGFVLFVATLEVRKNHQLVFEGWKRLIESEGVERVPTLVCIGKKGFRYDLLEGYLNGHPALASKVVLMSGISDVELDSLYAECLFTVHASFYEGWGLPVTESLCHGKVCLCADHSSLPEAGGRFAVYYSIDSVRDFMDKARRLMFDPAARASHEAAIAEGFRPRSWGQVLDGFIGQVAATWPSLEKAPPLWAEIKLATIYQTRRRPELLRLDRDGAVAEMLRSGASWHPLEDWGMWARERRAKLSFTLAETLDPAEDLLVYVSILCAGVQPATVTIRLGGVRLAEAVVQKSERRMMQARIPAAALKPAGGAPYVLEVETDQLTPLRLLNERDSRTVGVGLSSLMLCRASDLAARLNVAEREMMMVQD